METNQELINDAREYALVLHSSVHVRHTGAELIDKLCDALEAATTGTEWEYGRDCGPYGVDEWDSEQAARVAVQSWRGSSLVRRRPAGPWLPVEGT